MKFLKRIARALRTLKREPTTQDNYQIRGELEDGWLVYNVYESRPIYDVQVGRFASEIEALDHIKRLRGVAA